MLLEKLRDSCSTLLLTVDPQADKRLGYFKDMIPYHNFTNTSPPRTTSPILSSVAIRKYSANRSFTA